jgi:hypothetical protein
MIITSLGPGSESTPTVPNTCRFASHTYALPGPKILSTPGIVVVPYAIAPNRLHAADAINLLDTEELQRPEHGIRHLAIGIRGREDGDLRQPAIFASVTVISAVETSGTSPPGT